MFANVCSRKTPEQINTISLTPGVMKPRQSELWRRELNV
jgi:hypothetical protein